MVYVTVGVYRGEVLFNQRKKNLRKYKMTKYYIDQVLCWRGLGTGEGDRGEVWPFWHSIRRDIRILNHVLDCDWSGRVTYKEIVYWSLKYDCDEINQTYDIKL